MTYLIHHFTFQDWFQNDEITKNASKESSFPENPILESTFDFIEFSLFSEPYFKTKSIEKKRHSPNEEYEKGGGSAL